MRPVPPPLRVLVVDDNPDMVSSMMALLRLEGHDCKGLPDANDIVQVVREYEPHAIIMDITMPGKNGWAAAREIREEVHHLRPMLIGISGDYRKETFKMMGEMSGFDHYLVKPADPKAVMALLAKIAH